ncbi:DUF1836 domain-containing protein [Paenibacillus sp. N4]|uniref:DUF1836 domain-containing protein n=1 Tax=Paenibacillus vietnamensis TaxID=2590547 RepID=UPI001CD13B46|nr:DUF1836 domain-containing protein [Paenibacillus vietnamensis]MCA0753792.1 DUF1836 domain-containing protein [Paenibacillus vietnamensis]
MESFTLTRKEMACLLLSLDGSSGRKPLQVLQQAWNKSHRTDLEQGSGLPAFLSTLLPPIVEKLIKRNELKGLSLHEIAALGQLIEYSSLSVTSMQNWVKRDFKTYFDSPKAGKKYSLNQAAMLFIIDDLKSNLDFESIRKLFDILFRNPEDGESDPVSALQLYASYTTMFEELDANNDQLLDISGHLKEQPHQDLLTEQVIRDSAERFAGRLPDLTGKRREAFRNFLLVAVISIQTSYFHSLARRYCNATLFLMPD